MSSSSWQQKETETRMAAVPSECTAIDTKKRTAAGGGGAEKKKKPSQQQEPPSGGDPSSKRPKTN